MKPFQDKNLTLLGHLSELRGRLVKSVIAVVITSSISFVFASRIFDILTRPASGFDLIYIDMTELLGVYMKVCFTTGIALAMPFLVYEMLMFVFPALTSKEIKNVLLILPWITLMFIGGIIFSYFILTPPAVNFLLTFGNEIATPQIRIGSYINVVTRVILATGIIFELPVITTFLARMGIISSDWLARRRKIAFILAFILGAIITPTFDPVNQSLVAAPLIALFEISIWLAKLVQRKRTRALSALNQPAN
jgi:sec-independent protein translocase protein TatC